MRNVAVLSGVSALVSSVVGHATFQELWVNGKDQTYAGTCARLPLNNNPITDVSSNAIRCNATPQTAKGNCAVAPGDTVTIEMHQQAGDRSCASEAIGGAHYGPVQVYLTKVADATTADGSTPWFKVFQDTWAKGGASGSDDYWGTKDLNTNCGKMDFKIPAGTAAGDYLLRAEALALHSAASPGGAQFYVTCYQITVSGSGSYLPAGVSLPGAYKAADPGIQINIYQSLSTYIAPGPAVVPGGQIDVAGKADSGAVVPGGGSGGSAPMPTSAAAPVPTTMATSAIATSAAPVATSAAAPPAAPSTPSCSASAYQQCGGKGFQGCTTCATGLTCKAQGDYYSQCL